MKNEVVGVTTAASVEMNSAEKGRASSARPFPFLGGGGRVGLNFFRGRAPFLVVPMTPRLPPDVPTTDLADRLYERLLVQRCQTGDGVAFEELVRRYAPRLRYYLRKMLADHAIETDDVLQDVWLSVFRDVPRLADAAAFPAWLYRVARNQALRQLRRSSFRDALVPVSDDVPDDTGEDTFSAEEVDLVHAALDHLPGDQREVLVLRFVESMSYENIAAVLGCRVGTVRSRLHYAKRALRQVLDRTADFAKE
jgi:RNA polymerase sigma-70 factor (ECF subfamily)